MNAAPVLELSEVTKSFGEVTAVASMDLALAEGEFLTLLGPSGCGKTTALRLVAGFESPDRGRVLFRGEDVTGLSPQRRGFGMVFQNYALFPHLDVFENVAFGLRARGEGREAMRRRVERALERVDLPGFGGRRVQELSGGQQQRVALARALAVEPPLLLLDEPLSNLDAALRERTRGELRSLVKELGITALFVTHDQEEAFDLSDRVAVMREGRILQTGAPEALYREPSHRFVAGFVGRVNVIPALLEAEADGDGEAAVRARIAGEVVWRLPAGALRAVGAPTPGGGRASAGGAARAPCGPPAPAGRTARVELLVRPEDLSLGPAPAGARGTDGSLAGRVRDRRFRGAVTAYLVEVGDGQRLEVSGGGRGTAGEEVAVHLRPGARVHVFPAQGAPS